MPSAQTNALNEMIEQGYPPLLSDADADTFYGKDREKETKPDIIDFGTWFGEKVLWGGVKLAGGIAESLLPIGRDDPENVWAGVHLDWPAALKGLGSIATELDISRDLQNLVTSLQQGDAEGFRQTFRADNPTLTVLLDMMTAETGTDALTEAILGDPGGTQWREFQHLLKDEPWAFGVHLLAFARTGALTKAKNLRTLAKTKTGAEASHLTQKAERLEKAANRIGAINPEELPGNVMSQTAKHIAHRMAQDPTVVDAEIKTRYGIDEKGRELTTTRTPREMAETYGAGVENTPVSGLALKGPPRVISEMLRKTDPERALEIEADYEKTAEAIREKQRSLVDVQRAAAETDINLHSPEVVGTDAVENYAAWQRGEKTELGKELEANRELTNRPITTVTGEGTTELPPPRTDTPTGDTHAGDTPVLRSQRGTHERMIKGNYGGKYTGRYGVDNLNNFIFSHFADGRPNPAYPTRFQPRDRTDASSTMQIKNMARNFDPELALDDTSAMNDGAALVKRAEDVYTPEEIQELEAQGHQISGKWVVLSGNGRMAAMRYAVETPDYHQNIQNYKQALTARAADFGVQDEIGNHDYPVLFREVTDDFDDAGLEQFVEEANDFSGKEHRAAEIAGMDAKKLDPDLLSRFQKGEYPSLRAALKDSENQEFVNAFISRYPKDKQSRFYDATGKRISDDGYARIERAMLVSVFDGDIGEFLTRRFVDVSDPGLLNLRQALTAALPELAEMKYLFEAGERDKTLDITEDLANAVLKTQQLVDEDISIEFAKRQGSLFEGTEFDAMSDDVARLLYVVQRGRQAPTELTNFIRWYSNQIKAQASPEQGTLIETTPITKAEVLEAGLGTQFEDVPDFSEMRTQWETDITEKARQIPDNTEATASNIVDNVLVNTNAEIKRRLTQSSGDPSSPNNPDIQKTTRRLQRMIESVKKKAAAGTLTINEFKQLRTDFNTAMDVFKRQGQVLAVGEGTVAGRLSTALREDFINLLEAEVAANPDQYPQGFIEKVRIDNAQWAALRTLEKSPAATFIRAYQNRPGAMVDALLNPNSNLTAADIKDFEIILGNKGWKILQAGMLSRLFQGALDRETGIKLSVQNINKRDKNRLRTLFGDDLAITLSEMAHFTERVFSPKGEWNTPYVNALLQNPNIESLVLTTGLMSAEGVALMRDVFDKAGVSEKLVDKIPAISIAIALLAYGGRKPLEKRFTPQNLKQWVLEGNSWDVPLTGGKVKLDAYDFYRAHHILQEYKIVVSYIAGRLGRAKREKDKRKVKALEGRFFGGGRDNFFVE